MTNNKKRQLFKQFGHFLHEKRLQANYSQLEVSKKLGYKSAQFVSNFERGLCMPPLSKLRIIANLYNLKPIELADRVLEYKRDYIYSELKVKRTRKRKASQ